MPREGERLHSMQGIYLDHAATTPVRPEVAAAIQECFTVHFGNPSSPHAVGLAAEAAVRRAREQVAAAAGVSRDEVVFTSGGTEANNLALRGAARTVRRGGGTLLCSAIEHPSVLETVRALQDEGFSVRQIPVDRSGAVRLDQLAELVDANTRLVSVAYVNNEIGAVQDIAEVVRTVRQINPDAVIHTDAVQALGKLPLAPWAWGVDLVSLSAHKIGGPKGVGALLVRRGTRLVPLLTGGEQEAGLRSGTENVPGIVGFGLAAELAAAEMDDLARRLGRLRRRVVELVQERLPVAQVLGPPLAEAAPHIVNLALPGVKGEVMVRLLSEAGVYVSTGSACSAKKRVQSHVIASLGVADELKEASLRISLGRETTEEDVERAAEEIVRAYEELVQWRR